MFNYLSVLGKAHTIFIFFGEYGVFQRPGDVQFRIVPAQAGFHFGVIVFRTLVMEMGKLAENGKAVRKTGAIQSWCWLSAESSHPYHWPKVGEAGRISTATSKTLPRETLTSLPCANAF